MALCGSIMEPTYTVLGGDGNQYGPVTGDQLRGWVREGRVTGETQIWRSDSPDWVAASTLSELGVPAVSPVGPIAAAVAVAVAGAAPLRVTMPTATAAADPNLERRVKSGAGWFYWIAAFSLINSIMVASGSGGGFALGLGVTGLIDALAANAGGAAKAIALTLNFLAAGVLVLFGFFAGKGHGWAFIIGMILLALDTVLTGLVQMWMSLALHLFALFCIFAGFKASRALR
jgi:hypothetical protein